MDYRELLDRFGISLTWWKVEYDKVFQDAYLNFVDEIVVKFEFDDYELVLLVNIHSGKVLQINFNYDK